MIDDRDATTPQRKMSLKSYRKMKLRMLEDFCIKLTDEERARANTLTSEAALDQFCITILNNRWN